MKVLIIKTSSMGDIIHTLPAVTDACKNKNGIFFDWVVEENFVEIPYWHNNIGRVIPIALRRWKKNPIQAFKSHEVQNFIKMLRAEKYDLIIDAQGLIKSAFITLLARGNTWHAKCGLAFNSAKEPIVSLFYERKFVINKDQHAITRLRELFAKVFNYPQPLNFPDYGIKINNENVETKTEKYLVFIHAASRAYKCWSIEKWIELANKAAGENYTVKLPWGNDNEKYVAERIAANSKNVEVLPKLSLSEIAAIIFNSSGVVAVDTGLAHLAAAVDVPIVALYGKTDTKLIGIFGKRQKQIENFMDVESDDVWDELLRLKKKVPV